ncbi:MAG: 50S ribosome-binding GTPase, partial [Pyrinomonadaceae bacterium]|nr:50S ribosome-binding GTPase [Pyrinomonadaceae bacterium]
MVALAGNPNAGKTTLFNSLTGLRQKVANYPGVTVERKEGVWPLSPELLPARLIDLPGLYSLDATSIDEQIARNVITGRMAGLPAPDVIIAVVDATNLERNLYLVAQLLEYGRPLIVALTMTDLAARRKLLIDAGELSAALGVQVVALVASQKVGIDELAKAVLRAAERSGAGAGWRLPELAERELAALVSSHGNGLERYAALHELFGEELPEDEKRREVV